MGRSVKIRFLLLSLVCMLHSAYAVRIDPDGPSVTVPYNNNLSTVVELPLDWTSPDGTFTTAKKVKGCAPEQVSLTYFGADSRGQLSLLVSWATCNATVETPPSMGDCTGTSDKGIVTKPLSTQGIVSKVYWGPDGYRKPSNLAVGQATSYVYDYSPLGGIKYASPILHHVLIRGLQPGKKYRYVIVDNVRSASPRTADDDATDDAAEPAHLSRNYGESPFIGRFKAPGQPSGTDHYTTRHKIRPQKDSFPFKVAVIGDPGETFNTTDTLRHIMAWDSDLLWILGDLTYADRPDLAGVAPAGCNMTGSLTYQPRWDTWSRLFQPLLSKVPVLTTNGNHEIEPILKYFTPYNTNFTARNLAYNARFPVPQYGPTVTPKSFGPATPQPGAPTSTTSGGKALPGAYANMYYKAEIPGVATTIWLTSYSPYDVYAFSQDSEQMVWLKRTLQAVDRKKTPWLTVVFHAPLYNTYASHFKENECFRQAVEPLLRQYSVDIIMMGHVHAYERMKPVYDYQVDTTGCAPMHITIGDAGNVEGAAQDFISPSYASKSNFNCSAPEQRVFPTYQPERCFIYNKGPGSGCANDVEPCYCYANQPSWSAYRQPSFGHGELTFISDTRAEWRWFRNQDQAPTVADAVTITRIPACST